MIFLYRISEILILRIRDLARNFITSDCDEVNPADHGNREYHCGGGGLLESVHYRPL